MQDLSSAIHDGAGAAEKAGFNIPERLSEEIAQLDNPKYRVAVVGKYQVGKSALINHLFFGSRPILLEGAGLCTTAIPTEVEYGSASRMEVWHWSNGANSSQTLAETVDNPTIEDLKRVTVGEDRKALVQQVSRVKLTAANESLRGYTVLDTPGIDDPDVDLLINTTYRLIPECDLALVVVEPRQLDSANMDLLRKKLFDDGIARIMVMVSYKPGDGMDTERRKEIAATIHSQLASIGKGDIPVEMYCFDPSVDDIMCDVSEIELRVNSFLAENARVGRLQHVAMHLRKYLEHCLLEIAARKKAATLDDAESDRLLADLKARKEEILNKCDALKSKVSSEIETLKRNAGNKIRARISRIFTDYACNLERCKSLKELQLELEMADRVLKPRICDLVDNSRRDIEGDANRALNRCLPEMESASMEWSSWLEQKLEVDGGMFSNAPSWLLECGNIVISNILLPGGWIIALLGRGLQTALPLLQEITLQNGARLLVLRNAKKSLEECEKKCIDEITVQIDDNFDKIQKQVENLAYDRFMDQLRTVEQAFAERRRQNATPAESPEISQTKAQIERAIAAIDAARK